MGLVKRSLGYPIPQGDVCNVTDRGMGFAMEWDGPPAQSGRRVFLGMDGKAGLNHSNGVKWGPLISRVITLVYKAIYRGYKL